VVVEFSEHHYSATLQKNYAEDLRKMELAAISTFTLLFSFGFMAATISYVKGLQPLFLALIYLAGTVVTGIRMFPGRIVRETVMRPVTFVLFFIVLVGNTIASIHSERPLIAFVALYGAAPCLCLTHFWSTHFLLGLFAIAHTYLFSRKFPDLVQTYCVIFVVMFFVAKNTDTLYRRAFLEKHLRLRADEHVHQKQRELFMQAQVHLGMQRLYHVIKNLLVGAVGMLEMESEFTAADRLTCINLLKQGIAFIMERTAFSALAAGNYVANPVVAVFPDFFANLAVPPFVERKPADGHPRSLSGKFEVLLLRCALVDSITNAMTHGQGAVRVEYWVDANLSMLFVGVYNRLKADAPPLTRERIEDLFKEGMSHGGGISNSGKGLSSVKFMLSSLGGALVLSQLECAGEVECLLSLPVCDVVPWRTETTAVTAIAPPATAEPVTFLDLPKQRDANFRVVALDDSQLFSKIYRKLLHAKLGLPQENVIVLSTNDEARDAANIILGIRPAIVLLDQNIDFISTSGVCYFGTHIALELRERGFEGFVCLCTAHAGNIAALSPADLKQIGIDLIVDKSTVAVIAAEILAGFNAASCSSSPRRDLIGP